MMLPQLDTYDWEQVFGYAGEKGAEEYDICNYDEPKSVPFTKRISESTFTREDVVEIYGMYEGERDADDWLIVGRLKDDRIFMIEAGCDYTGWD